MSLGYSISNPYSTSFKSPAEQSFKLLIPSRSRQNSQDFPSRSYKKYMALPSQRNLLLSTRVHQYFNYIKIQHILSSIQRFILLKQTMIQQINLHAHTLHPYIINIDKINTFHHTFHAT